MKYLASMLVASISLILFHVATIQYQANAQQTSTTTGTNFTKLLSQQEFQHCRGLPINRHCAPIVDVLYESTIMLVLKSTYDSVIWNVVEMAKKEGYKVDGISTFVGSDEIFGTHLYVLAVMSKG